MNDDQSLGLELKQGFAYRYAAYAELFSERFLPDLIAAGVLAAHNASAELLSDRTGDGLALDNGCVRLDLHDATVMPRRYTVLLYPICEQCSLPAKVFGCNETHSHSTAAI